MEPIPVVSNKTCNVQLLQEILSKFWNKQVEVTTAKTEPATTRGNNFVSDAWRVSFVYKEVGQKEACPDTVVIKSRPTNEAQNALMHTDIAFKNEIVAYEKIIPTLNKFLCSPLRVPKYLHGDRLSIALEDMNNRSFRSINKRMATDFNPLWSPLQEMAKLHAASITMQRLCKDGFEKLINEITEVPFDETTPLGEKQATIIDTILQTLENADQSPKKCPEIKRLMEIVASLKENAWKEQKKIIEKEVPIRVINHGSIWINNLLYTYDMCTLLDWQHIVYSSPATDLCFFLYVNLDTDFLSNNRGKLLDFYLMNLRQSIYDMCVDKLSIIEIDDLLAPLSIDWIDGELRRCSLYGYMMAQWITPVFYWSEATFQLLEQKGGIEKLSVKERFDHMTSEQRGRVVKLTKFYFNESKVKH